MPILKNQHDESNSSKAFDICVEVFSNKLQKYGKGLVVGMSTLSIRYAILNIKQKKSNKLKIYIIIIIKYL
jgi:hypothetical protein